MPRTSAATSPHGPVFVVDDAQSLSRLRNPSLRSTVRAISLAGPLLDPDLERRLNRAYFACGCESGSSAVAATLLVCVVGAIATGVDGLFGPWRILGYLVAAALVGKLAGLVAARVQVHLIERRLSQRLSR